MKLFRKKGTSSTNVQSSVLVGDAEGSSSLKKSKRNSSLMLIVGFVMLVTLLAGALVGYMSYKNRKNDTAKIMASTVCSGKSANGMLKQAAQNLDSKKVKDLKPIAEKIQTLKGYDSDPNCLYILTKYYINLSDSKNARINYDKLVISYKPDSGYDVEIKNIAGLPSQLKSMVEFLEKRDAQVQHNEFYGPPV